MSSTISVLFTLLLSYNPSYGAKFDCNLQEDVNSCSEDNLNINKRNKQINKKNIFQREANKKSIYSNLNKSQSTFFSKTKITYLLPERTPLLAVANTSPSDWQKIKKFQLFKMAEVAASPFIPSNFRQYAQYLQPFAGNHIAFAFLPKSSNLNADVESNFIMFAEVQKEETLRLFINQFISSNSNQKIKKNQYKGIDIIEIETNEKDSSFPEKSIEYQKNIQSIALKNSAINPSIPKLPNPKSPNPKSPNPKPNTKLKTQTRNVAFALISGHIVAGISVKPIEKIIDISQGNIPNLANSQSFQSTLKHSQAGSALFGMYQNPKEYIAILKDFLKDPLLTDNPSIPKNPNVQVPPVNLDEILKPELFEKYKSVNSFVTVRPKGLRFQIATYLKNPPSPQSNASNFSPGNIISLMPGTTYSTLTGSNINSYWQSFTKLLSTQPQTSEGLESFRNYSRTFTGLDFDRDIIEWMDGEYAFFSYPTKGGFLKSIHPKANIGIGLNIQTSNRVGASATLTRLDKLIQNFSNNQVTVNKTEVNGHPITSWESKEKPHQSLFAYSWVNENTLILTTGKGAIASLVPKPYLSLSSAYNFNNATNTLPYPNQGYFYINTGSFLSWVYNFLPKEFNDPNFQIFKQAIGSVYSISATTSNIPGGEQFDCLMVLAPVRTEAKFLGVKSISQEESLGSPFH
ncbi:MAG: DUF3352 domain-containing protein [Mastigocoleus sp.]